MFVPSMLNMADVMAESRFTEEQVFDLGLSKSIVFLVVVPLVGACQVPNEALSHFMAGADEYTADAMPEHYSGALSGRWTIKRERLRILPASWDKWAKNAEEIQALCELCELQDAEPIEAPVVAASASAGAVPSSTNWKMLVQAEAASRFKRLRASGASPTSHSILDDMATWCRTNDVKTGGGIYPSAGYLRTHVLGGKHWTPP